MARIRSIKPDAFMSDSLSRVPRGVRWTFAGLWTYLDDEGRGRDDVRLIKAALYPLDDDVALSMLSDDLKQLEHIGCICRYEVDGKTYMHAPGWDDHQRVSHPTASKLPRCSRHDPDPLGKPPEEFGKAPESLRPERKGKEQGKEQGTRVRATADAMFDAFWSAYPRRIGKPAAIKAWKAALKRGAEPTNLVSLAAAFAKSSATTDPKFIPYPQKWLNDERYADEPLPESRPAATYWSPEAPPREIADDPERYSAWYAEQAANRGAS